MKALVKFKKYAILFLLIASTFFVPEIAWGAGEYGYIPDPLVGIPTHIGNFQSYAYPEFCSLAQYVIDIENQEQEPWCVAYGVTEAIEAQMRMQGFQVPPGGFSKSYLYTRCKQLDGIPNQKGTYIRTALEIATTEGLCPEALCPTDKYKNTGTLPGITPAMRDAAAKYKIEAYKMLQDSYGYADVDAAKASIAANHFVVVGTFVEDSWRGNGYLLDPFGMIYGSHCTFWEGYDSNQIYTTYKGFMDGVNSWGSGWGLSGKYNMSYHYATWRDLSVGMPMILEAWTFDIPGGADVQYIDMPIPMQIISPGYTVLPFRVVFEALGGKVDWGYNSEGKIWVRGNVDMDNETVTLEMTQGESLMKVTRTKF